MKITSRRHDKRHRTVVGNGLHVESKFLGDKTDQADAGRFRIVITFPQTVTKFY